MSLEWFSALSDTAFGTSLVIAIIVFFVRLPQILDAARAIADQIRQAGELGVDRIEGANNILAGAVEMTTESAKMFKEAMQAALDSRQRLEARYDSVIEELASTSKQIEELKKQLAEKDAEIAQLRKEIGQLRDAEAEKDKMIEGLKKQLTETLAERDELLRRITAVEQAQADIKPAEAKPDEKAA